MVSWHELVTGHPAVTETARRPWNPNLHPRLGDGRFRDKAGGWGTPEMGAAVQRHQEKANRAAKGLDFNEASQQMDETMASAVQSLRDAASDLGRAIVRHPHGGKEDIDRLRSIQEVIKNLDAVRSQVPAPSRGPGRGLNMEHEPMPVPDPDLLAAWGAARPIRR